MDPYKPLFLRTFSSAALALAASGLIVIILSVLYIKSHISPDGDRRVAKDIPASSLELVIGDAQTQGNRLEIARYQQQGSGYHALMVFKGRFEAKDFPLLNYQVDSRFPGPALEFIWWTANDPATTHSVKLNRTDSDDAWQELARNPEWRGTVVEIGLHAIATAPDQPLSIARLALAPYDWRAIFASYWSGWTAFRGWSPNSINFQYGTPDRDALSPVVVAALWSALAVVLLWVVRLFAAGIPPGAFVAVILLPWILLDLQWQKELMTQLTETRNQFAGKTIHEKHLADIDSDIYRYITRLKATVLRKELSRIAILQDSTGHNFERLKAQYYLLPNNVYNLGAAPELAGSENLNYILVLGEVPGLELRADKITLAWDNGTKALRVRLEDVDPMGTLYKVRHERRTQENEEP